MRAIYALCFFLAFGGMACPEAKQLTADFGFISLNPPSTLYVPGSILAVEPTEDGTLDTTSIKLLCGPRASLGPDWRPIVSQTISQEVKQSSKSSWHLSPDVLNQVKSSAHADSVADIQVTLSDAKILQMTDTDLLASLPNRSPECRQAILARLKSGATLTMVSSALLCDMVYTVKFRESVKVDKRARSQQMADIGLALGGNFSSVSATKIIARGLAIGIKTDSFLMLLGVPELNQDGRTGFDDAQLAIDVPETQTNWPTAPIVLPRGSAPPTPVYER